MSSALLRIPAAALGLREYRRSNSAKARGDRDRGSLARELNSAIRLIGELKRELKAGGDTNVLIVTAQRDELRGELEEVARLHDAEMSAVVGGLAGFPEARRSVMASLARARAHAEHDRSGGPGYPALPAPGEEAVTAAALQAEPAEAGVARPGGDAADQLGTMDLLPVEHGQEPVPAADPAAPPVPRERRDPQGRPLPPGVVMESGRPRPRGVGGIGDPYGDGGPLDSRD